MPSEIGRRLAITLLCNSKYILFLCFCQPVYAKSHSFSRILNEFSSIFNNLTQNNQTVGAIHESPVITVLRLITVSRREKISILFKPTVLFHKFAYARYRRFEVRKRGSVTASDVIFACATKRVTRHYRHVLFHEKLLRKPFAR